MSFILCCSAIPSLPIMARIRVSEKMENKPATIPLKVGQRVPSTPTKMSSSLSSSSSDSYSSSPETSESKFPLDFENIIDGVDNIIITSSDEDEAGNSSDENQSFWCEKNIVESDDEKSDKSNDEHDDRVDPVKFVFQRNFFIADGDDNTKEDSEKEVEEDDLQFVSKLNILKLEDDKPDESSDNNSVESDCDEFEEPVLARGPVRPQLHPTGRSKPYVESAHQFTHSGIVPAQPPPSESSTDYDTSAKAILTDQDYRRKMDLCLDQLSDMGQDRSVANSLSPGDSDFGGASNYSVRICYFN